VGTLQGLGECLAVVAEVLLDRLDDIGGRLTDHLAKAESDKGGDR
jgi:hypothetical protein